MPHFASLLLALALAGCCSSRSLDAEGRRACDAIEAGREEARRGWRHAREGMEVPTQPTMDRALRVGMPAAEVRERLGEPAAVTGDDDRSIWTYAPEGQPAFSVTLRGGHVARWGAVNG